MGSGSGPPQPAGAPRPKRQIIKTRSQRPYVVARVVVLVLILAVIAIVALAVSSHLHLRHVGIARSSEHRQEARIATRMPTIRQWSYRRS